MVRKNILNPFKIAFVDDVFYYDETKGLFVDNGIFHDIFRVNGFPKENFFDFESLKKWILDNSEKYLIQIDKEGWERLEKYWKDYPDSMVDFG